MLFRPSSISLYVHSFTYLTRNKILVQSYLCNVPFGGSTLTSTSGTHLGQFPLGVLGLLEPGPLSTDSGTSSVEGSSSPLFTEGVIALSSVGGFIPGLCGVGGVIRSSGVKALSYFQSL